MSGETPYIENRATLFVSVSGLLHGKSFGMWWTIACPCCVLIYMVQYRKHHCLGYLFEAALMFVLRVLYG